MDKKQNPELSQAELPPTQEEQVPVNPRSRKRQRDSDDDAELRAKRAQTAQPTLEPARLTRQNLARFNKMSTKKTSDPSDDSGSTKTLSTTASGFDVRARKNGILDPIGSRPPKNLEEIRERLAAPRETASPPESVYEDYAYTVQRAANEATIVGETLPLPKTYPREPYTRVLSQAFTAFPKNMGFNDGLSAPQPDFIEGLEMEEFLPFPVDEYVQGAVLYKDDRRSVTLPHLAGEWKASDGSMREATRQSGYDGAALVYARNQALAFKGESDPPGHASITTFTTNGTQVHFYAHYATPTKNGALEYHQFPVKSTNLVNSYIEHKEGRRGLRNAQDHAKRQSQALRDQLKEHYEQPRSSGLRPIAEGAPTLPILGTELLGTYGDEDDHEVVEPQPVYQPTPPTSFKPKHSKSHHPHPTTNSSKAPSSTHSSTHSRRGKRRASSSQSSHGSLGHVNKHRSYWKKDASGRYYHKHSDGTLSWLDDNEDDGRD
ncbi:hypothetical protein B0T19DRAFT_61254 [Cercophora scortea]|uniref:DUF7924 domain-containing protein n=1 Tax=Cercophora scortea TaxID=314031 RepID=A0AAE0MMI5_9PEZI|nr:hypothetical protein B0T19DRAFT_61254 [Cercophora scortea]